MHVAYIAVSSGVSAWPVTSEILAPCAGFLNALHTVVTGSKLNQF